MTDPSNSHHLRPEYSLTDDSKTRSPPFPVGSRDPIVPLTNLAAVRTRTDSLRKYLADSVNKNILLPQHEIDRVNSELVSAIHQVIVNGASLLSFSFSQIQIQTQPEPEPEPNPAPKAEFEAWDKEDERFEAESEDLEVVEIDAVELLAEHIHLCEICGKGFKRDANLRMHMRAHGNQFKTPEALVKGERTISDCSVQRGGRISTRFSCPYVGCNRNKQHKNFRPLKSVICVKNHFKRSHCPKMHSCTRRHKKSFSVLADLKSHLKNCGESKWKCSCGTTFSRKDKLFGHMALFEGHMPALGVFDNGSSNNNNNNNNNNTAIDDNKNSKGLMFEEFGSVDNDDQGLQDVMMMSVGGSSSNSSSNVDWNINMMEDFFNF